MRQGPSGPKHFCAPIARYHVFSLSPKDTLIMAALEWGWGHPLYHS